MAEKESAFDKLQKQLEAERKLTRGHPERVVDNPIELTSHAFEVPQSQEVPIDFEEEHVAKVAYETEKAAVEDQFVQEERQRLEEQHIADKSLREEREAEVKKREARILEEEAILAAQKLEDEKRVQQSKEAKPVPRDEQSVLQETISSNDDSLSEDQPLEENEKKSFWKSMRNLVFNHSAKIRLRFLPLWLRLLIVLIFCGIAMVLGAMVGYAFLGKGNASDVFSWETWTHISDLVNKP